MNPIGQMWRQFFIF